jgi:hypothetical protein
MPLPDVVDVTLEDNDSGIYNPNTGTNYSSASSGSSYPYSGNGNGASRTSLGMQRLNDYIYNEIRSLTQGLSNLHTDKVQKWRDLYKGQPDEGERSFPWPNASNLVIQLIGTYVDMLRARIMGSIFEVSPLFVFELVGDWDRAERGSEQKEALEQFLNVIGLEPSFLDLYRVLSCAFDECIKFGTVFLKTPWEYDVEYQVAGVRDGKLIKSELVKYDGPRPEKLIFEKFLITPSASSIEQANFKCHIRPLKKWELEQRAFQGIYDDNKVKSILAKPDRNGVSKDIKDRETDKGATQTETDYSAEWDVHECHFPYWTSNGKYRLIVSYHYATKTILRAIYNFYPDNREIFDMGRLGWTDDGIYGYGFCEMLDHYQDEVSTMHNQAIDNNTLRNTSVLRVSRNSKLDSNFSIFPMAIIPGEQGEVEAMQLGSAMGGDTSLQGLTLELARVRAGVDPGINAQGGGITNPKKGGYSAMGTFSVLQEGNRRSNINITDMRYLHLKLGRKFVNQFAQFGVRPEALQQFGTKAQFIKMALQNIKNGRMNIPVKAATASVNKELEKQNDMLLVQILQRHQQGIAGIFQALSNPAVPDDMKKYLMGVIKSSSTLMSRVLRNFGHDDVSIFLPEQEMLAQGEQNVGNNNRGLQQAPGTTGGGPSIQPPSQEQGNNAPIPFSGGGPNLIPVAQGTTGLPS